MCDNKFSMSEIVPLMSKITKHKLNSTNYLKQNKTIRIYLRSINKNDHLTQDPPTDGTRQIWLRDDARLFLHIRNSIDSAIIDLIIVSLLKS